MQTLRENTGNSSFRIRTVSRQAPSITRPAAPRDFSDAAIIPPNMPPPSSKSPFVTISTSPGPAIEMALCSITLSPMPHCTVIAVPHIRIPGQTALMRELNAPSLLGMDSLIDALSSSLA